MSLYVSLDGETFAKLRRMAGQERRRRQEQAAMLIERALAAPSGPDPSSPDHVGAEQSTEEAQP